MHAGQTRSSRNSLAIMTRALYPKIDLPRRLRDTRRNSGFSFLYSPCLCASVVKFVSPHAVESQKAIMSARILDGIKIANDIRGEVAAEVKTMAAAGVRPGLAVVLVGHNPASEVYVRGKVKASEQVGLYSEQHT